MMDIRRFKRYLLFLTALVVILFLAGSHNVHANDFELARQYFAQAKSAQTFNQVQTFLKKSIQVYPTFDAWYSLGRCHLKHRDPEQALEAFRSAAEVTTSRDKRGLALARFGQTMSMIPDSDEMETIATLKNALTLMEHPPGWAVSLIRKKELARISRTVSAEQITKTLGYRSFGVTPSINIRIHFATNDHRLTPDAIEQVNELGRAMLSKKFKNKYFVITGHTDKRDTPTHNLDLSKKRAYSVYDRLITLYPRLSGRIKTDWKGETCLLYSGDTPDIHQLNRRIEISCKRMDTMTTKDRK